MATRPRTPTSWAQPSARRVYETLQPSSEMKETPEAFLLHVYLPGFTKDRIKITFVGSSRVVRITGERPIQGNRWSRFDKTYPVPENCEAETLQGKFDMGTLVLTMPKKLISQAAPKPELNTTPAKRGPGPSDKVAAEQNVDKKRPSLPSPVKGPSDLKEQKATQEDTSSQRPTESQKSEHVKGSKALSPPEPIRDRSPQKGQELQTVKRPAVTGKPQKGQEEFESKQSSTMTAVTRDQAEEKREEEVKLKARLAAVKKELEGKTEVAKKERISREVKEQNGKSSESRKPVSNLEKGIFKEKEIRTRKVSPKEAEPSALNAQEKDKESTSASENLVDIVGNGIRELAASAAHVVTRIAEGTLNDEEKHLLANMGAAVLVLAALGAYASFKLA